VDIAVQHGGLPEPGEAECESAGSGTTEFCEIDSPAAGDWYILLEGFEDGPAYSGVILLATTTTAPTGTLITANTAVPGLAGAAQSQRLFRVVVPPGTTRLQVTTFGGAGDVELIVQRGNEPASGQEDCVSLAEGNEESCVFVAPVPGDWYILLEGFFGGTGYSGVTLLATTSTTALTSTLLTSGTPVAGISGAVGSEQLFRIAVPAGRTRLTVTTTGGGEEEDVDLFVSTMVAGGNECVSESEASTETCIINNPVAGDWYILLRGFTAYTGVTLTATYTP
jgi:hypothetical protein